MRKGLKKLERYRALGSDNIIALWFCKECTLEQSYKTIFKIVVLSTKDTLNYLHEELWGPSQIKSLVRARYFLFVIYDYFRMAWVHPLKSKD